MSDLNSRYFIKHYIQLLADLRNRKSKSENSSPISPTTKTLTQSTLLSKYQIGIPKSLNISTHSTPISTPSKQRRMSWIPSLTKK
jgi:ABC-type transporter MlaC component